MFPALFLDFLRGVCTHEREESPLGGETEGNTVLVSHAMQEENKYVCMLEYL